MADPAGPTNPLLGPCAPDGALPPFEAIRPEHFPPALAQAMAEQMAELDAIAGQPEPPTFANTVAALDRSGARLYALDALLGNLGASASSPELQTVQRDLAGPMAAHESAVKMHAGVFRRLDALFGQRHALGLASDELRLLERLHLDCVRAGAQLEPPAQARLAAIMQELATLCTRFSQNVLADEASFQLVLRTEAELAGLPDFVRTAARQAAVERGLPEPDHVITLNRSLVEPFLTFSDRRDLREQAWRAWNRRGENGGETDNRALIGRILQLRLAQAREQGFACYADFALSDSMAGDQVAVRELLGEVWRRALPAVDRERDALVAMMRSHGQPGEPAAWDWRYWSEKVRQVRYEIDDAEVKPYFSLDRMVAALFDCAGRLFGLSFQARPDLQAYHPDVRCYEVAGADGVPLGLFLQDNFARQTKRSGAWMSDLALRSANRGVSRAIILNNNNFAPAAPGQPTLLSFDDARTLFHEFGHGLHGLLSDVRFHRQAGTQVLRDFVELPSQLFEHWLDEPEVLRRHARHWQTDEPIPQVLMDKLQRARRWGQGYETVSYCASALVDLEIHALTDPAGPGELAAFEHDTLQRLGMPEAVGMRHRLPHFQHLFSGASYASGYYVYLWAEVLDADAFNAFTEAGQPFDAQVAARLLRHIYASGDSVDPRSAYTSFRGRLPAIAPLLAKRGLLDEGLPAS